jgi:hypothetical protein
MRKLARRGKTRRRLFGTKKRTALTLTLALFLAGGGVAFAQWVSEGQGTQTNISESTGSTPAATTVEIHVCNSSGANCSASGQAMTDGLTPGQSANLDFGIINPVGMPVQVSSVVVAATYPTTCPSTDWTLTQPVAYIYDNGTAASLPVVMNAASTSGSSFYDYDYNGGTGASPATITLNENAPTACANQTIGLSVTVS